MHDFPVDRLPRPLAVVCHDAGGANIIAAGLRGHEADLRVSASGPAFSIFRARFPELHISGDLNEALQGASALLSGTGWASDVEFQARRLAAARGILSVSVLDHWVNYRNRFIRNNVEILPDRIWVTDEYARLEANNVFGSLRVDIVCNPYVREQLLSIAPVDQVKSRVVLYILEPMQSDWGRSQAGEFQALDFFVQMLPRLGLPQDIQIRLRQHPSEADHKYRDWISAQRNLNVTVDGSATLGEAISCARWVAGCQSFGLALALAANRRVFCTLPPWAPACKLPQQGLVHLKTLVERIGSSAGDA